MKVPILICETSLLLEPCEVGGRHDVRVLVRIHWDNVRESLKAEMDEGAENCIAKSREVLATTAHRILQGDFRGKRGSKCFSCDYRDVCSVFHRS